MMASHTNPKFAREVEMYKPLWHLFPQIKMAVAEVPFFGKHIDLVFASRTCRSLYAIETKVQNWRKAFKQAALNQLAAQQSYVAVPEHVANRLYKYERDLFIRYDIGLIAVGNAALVLIPAVRNACFSLRHHHVLKRTIRKARGTKPHRIGAVADAISKRSKSLVLLQTRSD